MAVNSPALELTARVQPKCRVKVRDRVRVRVRVRVSVSVSLNKNDSCAGELADKYHQDNLHIKVLASNV